MTKKIRILRIFYINIIRVINLLLLFKKKNKFIIYIDADINNRSAAPQSHTPAVSKRFLPWLNSTPWVRICICFLGKKCKFLAQNLTQTWNLSPSSLISLDPWAIISIFETTILFGAESYGASACDVGTWNLAWVAHCYPYDAQ